jgi:hypothetical protein
VTGQTPGDASATSVGVDNPDGTGEAVEEGDGTALQAAIPMTLSTAAARRSKCVAARGHILRLMRRTPPSPPGLHPINEPRSAEEQSHDR